MIRVVFDTNVLYSAIFKRTGHEARAFDLVAAGLVIPCVSETVLREYRRVLFGPDLAVHAKRASEVLAILESVALHVIPTEDLKISGHDDDNRFYECAAAALADYIITGNARHFKRPYKNTLIVTARQLLELVGE